MRQSPMISIVLPTYNGEKYIRQSIESCLNQTYKAIELIIVDDASTDNTASIITSYKDNRIKYIKHENNKGLPTALNTGFAQASGEYLTWTSDDNYYSPKALQCMIEVVSKENCPFVFCDYYVFRDNDYTNKILVQLPDKLELSKRNDVGACFLYSRMVKETVGDYDTETFLAEDYDYWIRVSMKFALCHLNEPLYYYRTHAGSLARSRLVNVKISSVLVRIKHNVININSALDLLINSAEEIYWDDFRGNTKFIKLWFYLLSKVLFIIFRKPFRLYLTSRVINVLMHFQSGMLDFTHTKAVLLSLFMKTYGVLRRAVSK